MKTNFFDIVTETDFTNKCLQIFDYQSKNNLIYNEFLKGIKFNFKKPTSIQEIPFLPINFFKTHTVLANNLSPEITFSSSGTTGNQTSKHYVADIDIYRESFKKGFNHFYGDIKDYCILALLPSYLEREGSSLILMCEELIKDSKNPLSGFFLYDFDKLNNTIALLEKNKNKFILIGVTYALLDFSEQYPQKLNYGIVMETGGMKGKRKELIRPELHETLKSGFGVNNIHSEYGMTELLSQAYSSESGIFKTPPWMKVMVRDTNDPLSLLPFNQTGGLNIIDLANIYSCSFIATQDLGKAYPDGSFEILGRFDNSDIRGCNLLVQ